MINDNGFMLSEILTRIGYPSYEAERIEKECEMCLASEKVSDSVLYVSNDSYLTGGRLYEEIAQKFQCSEEEVQRLERELAESDSCLRENETELNESNEKIDKLNDVIEYLNDLIKYESIVFNSKKSEDELKSKLYDVEDI